MLIDIARPTISVVTISYNQAEFLEQTIISVLSQKGVDIDYIVVDPGSTDGSREIIEQYRSQISHVIFEKDDGPADGLNRGLSKARGEFFYYLNSDDVVLDNAFAEAITAFHNNPDANVVYGNGLFIDRSGCRIRKAYSARFMTADLYARGLSVLIQQATFFRTEALRRAGGFNVENRTCWDGEAVFNIALAGGRFRRIWRTWGAFRIHDASITGSGRLEEAYRTDQVRLSASVLKDPDNIKRKITNIILYFLTRIFDLQQILDRILELFSPKLADKHSFPPKFKV